ncbi:MAG TPA: hypothetical protein VFI23_13725 [Rhizomicrobium sp.]|nr:hypothetical protein [Rhizomicrobium sp.]
MTLSNIMDACKTMTRLRQQGAPPPFKRGDSATHIGYSKTACQNLAALLSMPRALSLAREPESRQDITLS